MKITVDRVGVTIAEALRENIAFSLDCGGKGKCGACRVRAEGELSEPDDTEKSLLGESISEWRLACRAVCMGRVTVTVDTKKTQTVSDTRNCFGAESPISKSKYGIAVDIGTTTIAAKLIESATGDVAATEVLLNPQRRFGADVMTRIEYAVNGGGEELRADICSGLCTLIKKLTGEYVDTAVIVGNTAMLCLLTGTDVKAMAEAPFTIPRHFGEFLDAKAVLGNCGVDRLYIAPCVSSFVGADTVSAMLACEMDEGFCMLADIGTNGEMAAVRDGRIICASAPAGPAFEGAELSCGMTAREGAVDSVAFSKGKPVCSVIGGGEPSGICGGGLVSAAAAMLEEGLMDESGYLDVPFKLAKNVILTPADIRMLQTAKSAIRSGIDMLADGDAPKILYLAGGFGSRLDVDACIRIGLLPQWARSRTACVGNAALGGACMMLQDAEYIRRAEGIAENAETAELDTSSEFARLFIDNMLFNK